MTARPLLLAGLLFLWTAFPAVAADHAIAMHGAPKYGPGFTHFDYVNPDAPKGGRLRLSRVGSFDSLNPFLVRGVPAAGLDLTFQSLLQRSQDEPFTLYALLAERVETADDRSWVRFHLNPAARFHDGSPVRVEDVAFSLKTLREHGRPNMRIYYAQVTRIERNGPRTVTLHFEEDNWELPLILGLMPILSEREFAQRDFAKTSLQPLQGAGRYRVAEVDPGRRIIYRRIPGHWSEDLPAARGQDNFDLVSYDYFRDGNAALLGFSSGQYDFREESEPAVWATGYRFPAVQRGEVRLEEIPHGRPSGMYGIALNTRRDIFQDRRVRRAIGHALDFEWLNRNLYHGAYERTRSVFDNSELAARGLPSPAERALLAPYRESLPPALFQEPYRPPGAALPEMRSRLRRAAALLKEAGWEVRDLRLVHGETGRPFRFEIMLAQVQDARLALHMQRNLRRLGIDMRVRTVDSAQYQQRLATYDFDAMIWSWGQSLSPGNEQAFYWSSEAAETPGTRNYPGIREPAVDAMIAALLQARSRDDLVHSVRAMDRVLLWGNYIVPLFHTRVDRVAYWDRFGRPAMTPLYGYRLETWWSK